jgi:Domain of unknown function (DUF4333)
MARFEENRRVRRLGVPGLVLLVAGCGTLVWDQSRNETNIRHALAKVGVQVQSVKCPKDVKVGKGVVTYCTATLRSGETLSQKAVQLDNKGDVSYSSTTVIATEVENLIKTTLSQSSVSATATCPRHVPIVVGNQFVCTLRDNAGHTAHVPVTIIDSTGSFSVGQPRP